MNDSSHSNHRPRAGLDQISTRWRHIQDPLKFVMRYAPAIQRYLRVFLKNEHDVEDVCQTFLLRVVERGVVEPAALRGRFRDYLIAAVRHAALAQLRRRPIAASNGPSLDDVPAHDSFEFPPEDEWLAGWRRVLLASVWEALEKYQREHPGNLGHTALRTMVDHPQEDSHQLAARVSKQSGRVIQPETFRKQVSRARRLFAEFLVAEVSRTLEHPTPLMIEEELVEIGLMKYVQPFLPPDWRKSAKA